MNFVPRTLFRWTLESHVGGNEEIDYERKQKKNERGSNPICTVSEMNLVYFHPPLD